MPYSSADKAPNPDHVKYVIEVFKLMRTHKYFSQIQGQLDITGYETCDLYIYTAYGSLTVSVDFDEGYWEDLKEALKKFYFYHYSRSFYEANH